MVIVSPPAPAIRAPQAFRKLWRSATSGSRAQLRRMVRPSARAAAIMMFSVPVTVGASNLNSAPLSRGQEAST